MSRPANAGAAASSLMTSPAQLMEGMRIHDDPGADGETSKVCSVCQKPATSSNVLFRCSRCGVVLYCSRAHQSVDWPSHKKLCVAKLSQLEDRLGLDLLIVVANQLPTGSDAVMLSLASKLLNRAVAASRWPPYSDSALVLGDGTVREPPSGRFTHVARRRDGIPGLMALLESAKPGATVLLEPGIWEATVHEWDAPFHSFSGLCLNSDAFIFGRGVVTILEKGPSPSPMKMLVTMVGGTGCIAGVTFEGLEDGNVLGIEGGHWRIQDCKVHVAPEASGIIVTGDDIICDVINCVVGGGRTGVSYIHGSRGVARGCTISGTGQGVYIEGDPGAVIYTRPIIEHNKITRSPFGIKIYSDVDNRVKIGPGNTFTGCGTNVFDGRIL